MATPDALKSRCFCRCSCFYFGSHDCVCQKRHVDILAVIDIYLIDVKCLILEWKFTPVKCPASLIWCFWPNMSYFCLHTATISGEVHPKMLGLQLHKMISPKTIGETLNFRSDYSSSNKNSRCIQEFLGPSKHKTHKQKH